MMLEEPEVEVVEKDGRDLAGYIWGRGRPLGGDVFVVVGLGVEVVRGGGDRGENLTVAEVWGAGDGGVAEVNLPVTAFAAADSSADSTASTRSATPRLSHLSLHKQWCHGHGRGRDSRRMQQREGRGRRCRCLCHNNTRDWCESRWRRQKWWMRNRCE